MSKVVRVAIPEQITYICDRCSKENIDIDVKLEFMDRDFQGGIVYSHTLHLCQSCRKELVTWLPTTGG